MKFINRQSEMSRLDALLSSEDGKIAIVYGRRRIGKTRLLLEWCTKHGGLYTVADQSTPSVQRRYMAEAIAQRFNGFADVEYPNWKVLLTSMARRAKESGWTGPWIIDELPYLVAADPSLPSILQSFFDHQARNANLAIALAGSSTHMMHGLALDAASPLFGRATEVMRLSPMEPTHLEEALGLPGGAETIALYAALGGIPRYWELAARGEGISKTVDRLVLDPLGPLHNEPERLLAMELPSAASLRPILDVIGSGAHRLSEIGGRTGFPATSLSTPIARLQDLGFVTRETPFGESARNSKRSLYKLADPFLRLWFRVVAPNRALLAAGTKESRKRLWNKFAGGLIATTFEELARKSVPGLAGNHPTLKKEGPFLPAGRFWRGNDNEWDVVALGEDEKKLLLGEVKWSLKAFSAKDVEQVISELVNKGIPKSQKLNNREIVHAVFVPTLTAAARKQSYSAHVVEAGDIVKGIG